MLLAMGAEFSLAGDDVARAEAASGLKKMAHPIISAVTRTETAVNASTKRMDELQTFVSDIAAKLDTQVASIVSSQAQMSRKIDELAKEVDRMRADVAARDVKVCSALDERLKLLEERLDAAASRAAREVFVGALEGVAEPPFPNVPSLAVAAAPEVKNHANGRRVRKG